MERRWIPDESPGDPGNVRRALGVGPGGVRPGPARLGLPEESLGFVSSNCWDVAGAKACGFPVVWVNRARAPLEELGLAPDLEVADLDGFARALGR